MEHPSLLPFEHEPFDDHEPENTSPETVDRVTSGLRELGEEISAMRREQPSRE